MATTPEEEDAPTCRFCFEGQEGGRELIAPCECIGSVKFIHKDCLRRWQAHQRLEAASQRADGRAKSAVCNIYHATLDAEPPTDAELLETVRPNDGRALAAALGPGVLLVATRQSPPDTSSIPGPLRAVLLKRAGHWFGHSFLIFKVEPNAATDGSDALVGVNVTREVRVDDAGKVVGASEAELLPHESLQDALQHMPSELQDAISSASAAGVRTRHFIGGPCEPKEIVAVHSETAVAGASLASEGGAIAVGGSASDVLAAAVARAQAQASSGDNESSGEGVVVWLCHGHARWSRAQLQNEVLRGDWGLHAAALAEGDGLALLRGSLTHAHVAGLASTRFLQVSGGRQE